MNRRIEPSASSCCTSLLDWAQAAFQLAFHTAFFLYNGQQIIDYYHFVYKYNILFTQTETHCISYSLSLFECVSREICDMLKYVRDSPEKKSQMEKVYFHCLVQCAFSGIHLSSTMLLLIYSNDPLILLLSVVCATVFFYITSFFKFTCNSSRFLFNQTHCPLLIKNKLFAILKRSFEWPIKRLCVTK